MTCQHCQTWAGQEEHRCPRCGRKLRAVSARISPATYPIAATATAPAYDFRVDEELVYAPPRQLDPTIGPAVSPTGQQQLFTEPVNEPRVVAFESLTTSAERESIRARAAEVSRPAPLKTERVELPRPRTTKHGGRKQSASRAQVSLDFSGSSAPIVAPKPSIICDAPVAPPSVRFRAALIDSAVMAAGCAALLAIFYFTGGHASLDKHSAPFLAAALLTVPLVYKLLWTFAGRDSIGMQRAGLQLVDFDGNPPSKQRRYQRLFGGVLSFFAAGIGLLWSFVDEDALTWHDHISNTFPTFASEE